ncbi:c-type cytochrome [Dongia sp.]|uniref:c-type cytochrome n=1 Tax=Dongia sp. TaxID=1977262 RepID=UPI0037522B2F
MRLVRVLLVLAVLFIIFCAGFIALTWKSEITRIARPDPGSFDPESVKRGAALAAVGNCIACHTVPGGKAFAGGLALPTPFGTIYSTNITPDEKTGIGNWSEEAFRRAMREGTDRDGTHLYPAFPYDHFTLVTDADNRALYAYLMTRQPVEAAAPRNDLIFPLNIRPLVAAWDLLFLKQGPYRPDPAQSDEWNRGAYLAEGLGHCGACHTPRNPLGAERRAAAFGGGTAEGWNAYAINAQSPAPIPWNRDSLAFYLRHGFHPEHGVSRGPMAEVTGNLAGLPDPDVAAIATYVASVIGPTSPERMLQAEELRKKVGAAPLAVAISSDSQALPEKQQDRGAAIYRSACAGCHEGRRPLPFGGLPFDLSTAVNAPDPQNIINVVMFGLPPADGELSAVMPAFGDTLGDDDIVALLNHLRRTFTKQSEWTGLDSQVANTRSGAHTVRVRPSDGIERGPANVGSVE